MSAQREFKTEDQRLKAKRERERDSVHRHKLRKAGEDVPNTWQGIARWWKKRGH
jgi:hypothetical protein